MYIPNGLIFLWFGAEADIPAGWERVASLDGKFIKGAPASTNPNVTGGGSTHTHTSPEHTHTIASHSHSGQTTRDANFETHGGGNPDCARDSHVHDYNISGISGGSLVDAITYQAGNSEPPFYSPIFITPSGQWAGLVSEIGGFWASASIPSGFAFCNGQIINEGQPEEIVTPDLRNKYLKGAAAEADAGATGGSLDHTHNVGHTHTARNHTHSGTSGYDSDSGNRERSNDLYGAGAANSRHTHTITLNAVSEAGSAYSGTVNASNIEPLHKKLMIIENVTQGVRQPRNLIGLWLGTLASIPKGWYACTGARNTPDMRDYHFKCANDSSEIATTGGSNTHSHPASNSHTHTAAGGHTHSGSANYTPTWYGTTANNDGASAPHSHNVNTCSSNTSTFGNATISGDSSNNEPPYRTVVFLQFQHPTSGVMPIQ